MFTRPSCPGPTWRPLTKCQGDYLRFFSDNLAETQDDAVADAPEVKFSQRFCWKQEVNFTYGYSDDLFLQFKTDRDYRARGFNCTVTCEGFDFSELFAKIPFTDDDADDELEEYDYDDYDDDYVDDNVDDDVDDEDDED